MVKLSDLVYLGLLGLAITAFAKQDTAGKFTGISVSALNLVPDNTGRPAFVLPSADGKQILGIQRVVLQPRFIATIQNTGKYPISAYIRHRLSVGGKVVTADGQSSNVNLGPDDKADVLLFIDVNTGEVLTKGLADVQDDVKLVATLWGNRQSAAPSQLASTELSFIRWDGRRL